MIPYVILIIVHRVAAKLGLFEVKVKIVFNNQSVTKQQRLIEM